MNIKQLRALQVIGDRIQDPELTRMITELEHTMEPGLIDVLNLGFNRQVEATQQAEATLGGKLDQMETTLGDKLDRIETSLGSKLERIADILERNATS